MKVNLYLSKKIDGQGHCEILMLVRRKCDGKVIDIRAKSGIFINPKMYDAKKKAIKTFSANKLMTEDVKYHNTQINKLNNLLVRINEAYNDEPNKDDVCGVWLENIVYNVCFPHKRLEKETTIEKKNTYQHFLDFLNKKQYSGDYHRGMMVCIRSVARYEMYVRMTDRYRKNFTFDVDTVTKCDIEEYREYLSKEKSLYEQHPELFKSILMNYPANIKRGNLNIENRGSNSIHKLMKKLKSFFTWMNHEGITSNDPFRGLKLGSEKYGTPYYITAKERDLIASAKMPTKHLETQRDIFIFQCFVGCRVGDLINLTANNITDNILVYTPHKTKEDGMQPVQARVPLHPNATELIEKYKDLDRRGRLFPFISQQKYNDAIKKIFTIAGVTRIVEIRNPLTGEFEYRPINEVASSHIARRTFVGNLYSKVADPNLIGKMSGHVDGSKAFARYRKIEDETLKNVIDLL